MDSWQGITSHPRGKAVFEALEAVTDPEIPVLNVIDMGIIADVRLHDRGVSVDVTPTFVACPAIDFIRENIRQALQAVGEEQVEVNLVFDPPWTAQRMSERGRQRLRQFGLAPPVGGLVQIGTEPTPVACPFCDSRNTTTESMFGPTLCRSIHYCRSCLQSFEHFKNL